MEKTFIDDFINLSEQSEVEPKPTTESYNLMASEYEEDQSSLVENSSITEQFSWQEELWSEEKYEFACD